MFIPKQLKPIHQTAKAHTLYNIHFWEYLNTKFSRHILLNGTTQAQTTPTMPHTPKPGMRKISTKPNKSDKTKSVRIIVSIIFIWFLKSRTIFSLFLIVKHIEIRIITRCSNSAFFDRFDHGTAGFVKVHTIGDEEIVTEIIDAVNNGKLTIEAVDACVKDVLNIVAKSITAKGWQASHPDMKYNAEASRKIATIPI